MVDIEKRLRMELWLNHGHDEGPCLYGDDGEMQCKACELWDYRREPIDKLIEQVDYWRVVHGAMAQKAAAEAKTKAEEVVALVEKTTAKMLADANMTPAHKAMGSFGERCRGCSRVLRPENYRTADGCTCNTPRGINHGLVPANTCTCKECDPAQTGSTRYAP